MRDLERMLLTDDIAHGQSLNHRKNKTSLRSKLVDLLQGASILIVLRNGDAVFGARDRKVYFFNSAGSIGKTKSHFRTRIHPGSTKAASRAVLEQ